MSQLSAQDIRFSVAPMMDWTTRHCRFFHRQLSQKARLYTEMVTPRAILFGDKEKLLGFSESEHPIALQLGSNNPQELAQSCQIAQDYHYDEINLNVGCPSDRVQGGHFGACLMKEPNTVAHCVEAMKKATHLPITVKCRIGVDEQDPQIALFTLAEQVFAVGCDALIVHARKAWLQGLSPKDNRTIPQLDYAIVYNLKQKYPDKIIAINGGIQTLEECIEHLKHVDGVMLGRAAYQNPELLLGVDEQLFKIQTKHQTAKQAVVALFPYIEAHLAQGGKLSNITRHMLGLFHGQKGARLYRQILSEEGAKYEAGLDVLQKALQAVLQD